MRHHSAKQHHLWSNLSHNPASKWQTLVDPIWAQSNSMIRHTFFLRRFSIYNEMILVLCILSIRSFVQFSIESTDENEIFECSDSWSFVMILYVGCHTIKCRGISLTENGIIRNTWMIHWKWVFVKTKVISEVFRNQLHVWNCLSQAVELMKLMMSGFYGPVLWNLYFSSLNNDWLKIRYFTFYYSSQVISLRENELHSMESFRKQFDRRKVPLTIIIK